MLLRTIRKTVTFRRPFILSGLDEVLPAGSYEVETEEELLGAISFPAYRRTVSIIHLHQELRDPGRINTLTINPKELDAAINRDQAPPEISTHRKTGTSEALHAQQQTKAANAQSFVCQEPNLDEVMSDPIVRLLMQRDRLSEADVWAMIKTAQVYLASRLRPHSARKAGCRRLRHHRQQEK